MKLTIRLENFKGVFALKCVVSDNLAFASVEIDGNYSLTLPRSKSLCHGLSCGLPQKKAGEREPGN